MNKTRLRDHGKGDLALTVLTVTTAAVAAAWEVGRWVATRHRRRSR